MVDPKVGDFFVYRSNGLMGKIIRWVTSSSVNHAGIYVGGGKVVEAKIGGAAYNTLEYYKDALWSTDSLPAHLVPTDIQRVTIALAANAELGVKYGILDILAIGLAQRRLGDLVAVTQEALDKEPWLVRKAVERIQNMNKLICSQLVDHDWNIAGVHLFEDGRIEGLVSPGNLRDLLTQKS